MSLETLSKITTTCSRKLISKDFLLDDTEIVREVRIPAVHSLSGKDAGHISLETENCYAGVKTDSRFQSRKL